MRKQLYLFYLWENDTMSKEIRATKIKCKTSTGYTCMYMN